PRSFVVNGSKNLVMAHPTRPGMELLHGATESPVSGVEYWGSGELDEGGRAAVELPEYFEGLAKPEGRAVLVTAKGGPVDWSEIDDGWFAVTGSPGQKFTWLVK